MSKIKRKEYSNILLLEYAMSIMGVYDDFDIAIKYL